MHGCPSFLSAFLSLSPLSFPMLSLCIPSLSSCPEYRIMTQFSWAARVSWGTVTMATAPVLLGRPAVPRAWVRLHRATRARTNLLVSVSVCLCAPQVAWWGWNKKRGRFHYFSTLISYLISVSAVFRSQDSLSYLCFSCSSLRRLVSNYWFTGLVCSDRPGERNNKPLSASGEEEVGDAGAAAPSQHLSFEVFNISRCHWKEQEPPFVLTVWAVTCHFN